MDGGNQEVNKWMDEWMNNRAAGERPGGAAMQYE